MTTGEAGDYRNKSSRISHDGTHLGADTVIPTQAGIQRGRPVAISFRTPGDLYKLLGNREVRGKSEAILKKPPARPLS